jgi:MFS family permease
MTRPRRSPRARFHALLALRYVPTGLSLTVLVLLLLDRGLSLAEIGLVTAAQGIVMLILELPSGALADAIGRRPVLVLAGGFGLASMTLLLAAHSVVLLAVGFGLQGVYRALDSGTLHSWFVDASLALDPGVEIERELARADVVTGVAIGAGALLGSLIVRFGGVPGPAALTAPLVLGLAVQAAGVVAVLLLVDETGPNRGWRSARRSLLAVPTVIADAVASIRAERLLAALVLGELLWGFGMVAFETMMPPRLAELGGGPDGAAAVLGPVVTAAWVVSALGSAAVPRLVRRFGAGAAGAGLRLAHGATVVAMGVAAGPAGLVVAYLATYGVHGASAPVHYGLVHRAVESRHRATVVSANSLTAQLGNAAGGIALGLLADATSLTAAMLVAALVLAAAAPLYLVRPKPAEAPVLETLRGP